MIFDCNNKQTTEAILTWTRIQGLSNRIRSLLCLIDCSCVTVISSHESIWNTAFKLCLHRIESCWFASAHPIGWRAPRDATMFLLGGTWSHLLFPSTFQFTSCVVLLESNFTYVGCYFLLFCSTVGSSQQLSHFISNCNSWRLLFQVSEAEWRCKGDKRLKVKNFFSL
jgi:hypothetical protein